MPLKQIYSNLVQLTTKNAVGATLLMILALTAVSTSAAQVLAPEDYKPTTVLGLNKVETKDSNNSPESWANQTDDEAKVEQEGVEEGVQNKSSALIADEGHEVVVLEACDLAVRYKKQYPQYAQETNDTTKLYTGQLSTNLFGLAGRYSVGVSMDMGPGFRGSSVECYNDLNQRGLQEFMNITTEVAGKAFYRYQNNPDEEVEKVELSLDKAEFCDRVGFNSQKSCDAVGDYKAIYNKGSEYMESSTIYEYLFQKDKKIYVIGLSDDKNSDQIDINSINPAVPSSTAIIKKDVDNLSNVHEEDQNVDLTTDNQEQSKAQNKSSALIADEGHEVVVLEACDLAVRYKKQYPQYAQETNDTTKLYTGQLSTNLFGLAGRYSVGVSMDMGPGFRGSSVECYNDLNQRGLQEFMNITTEVAGKAFYRYQNNPDEEVEKVELSLDKAEFCDRVGFNSQKSCDAVGDYKAIYNKGSEYMESSTIYEYLFQKDKKIYVIGLSDDKNPHQIDINSINPAVPSSVPVVRQ